jgi:putative hydrolase of the HAD superfamily
MTERVIEAAVFDLGGVVIEVEPARAIHTWAGAAGLSPDEVLRRLEGQVLSDAFERGEIGPDEFARQILDRFDGRLSAEAFLRGWNTILGGPLRGIEALLERLARRMRLVCLTNTNAIHAAEFRRTSGALLVPFERVFMSFEMGSRKPEAACFRQVLGYLGLAPDRVAYFDDNPGNVAAAARLGMAARVVNGPADVVRELDAMGIPC